MRDGLLVPQPIPELAIMPTSSQALDILRADEEARPWLDYLATLEPASVPITVPDDAELGERLAWCDVPDDVIPEIVAVARQIETDPDLAWLFDRTIAYLESGLDHWEWPPQIPPLTGLTDEVSRWFFAVVYATFLPVTLDLHRKRGISSEISRATMADIGRHVRIRQMRLGVSGLASPDWLWLHARGMIFQIGRLQFERAALGGTTSRALQAQGFDCQHREPCLAVHIPSFMGPLTPEVCDASFAQAREFFAAHFPTETFRLAVCRSWLLDEQLARFLPPTSNIVQFQQRFGIAYRAEKPEDGDTLDFIFRSPNVPLDQLPQRTTLERAVVRHLQAGGHFHGAMGWIPLT